MDFADFLTPRLQKRCVFFRKVDRFAKASPSVKDIRRGDFYSLSRYGTKTLLKSHSKTRSFSLLKPMTELAQTVLVRLMFFVPYQQENLRNLPDVCPYPDETCLANCQTSEKSRIINSLKACV